MGVLRPFNSELRGRRQCYTSCLFFWMQTRLPFWIELGINNLIFRGECSTFFGGEQCLKQQAAGLVDKLPLCDTWPWNLMTRFPRAFLVLLKPCVLFHVFIFLLLLQFRIRVLKQIFHYLQFLGLITDLIEIQSLTKNASHFIFIQCSDLWFLYAHKLNANIHTRFLSKIYWRRMQLT